MKEEPIRKKIQKLPIYSYQNQEAILMLGLKDDMTQLK